MKQILQVFSRSQGGELCLFCTFKRLKATMWAASDSEYWVLICKCLQLMWTSNIHVEFGVGFSSRDCVSMCVCVYIYISLLLFLPTFFLTPLHSFLLRFPSEKDWRIVIFWGLLPWLIDDSFSTYLHTYISYVSPEIQDMCVHICVYKCV